MTVGREAVAVEAVIEPEVSESFLENVQHSSQRKQVWEEQERREQGPVAGVEVGEVVMRWELR